MYKNTEQLKEIKLVGVSARTTNMDEANPSSSKIGPTISKFFMSGMQAKIPNRKRPGRVFAVYTGYESDLNGEYTYFVGEEVEEFIHEIPEFQTLVIPEQNYIKFTSEPGKISNIVVDMWRNIWSMDPATLGGERRYAADFEIYDERSQSAEKAVVDIYIGIK
jgi:predicted transcriptional regulator YdeE